MGKKYRIDYERNVGTVLFVVEGGTPNGGTELRLLKSIFADLLGFEMHELRRNTGDFIGYSGNSKSRVIGLNLLQNQVTQITDERLDELYERIRDDLGLNPDNFPLFFLYDRDVKSYRPNQLRTYVQKYTDPYTNESGDRGQLLLSYPAVESYLISCHNSNSCMSCYELGRDVKVDAASWGCTVESISADVHILHAVQEMDDALASFGLDQYDLDNLKGTLLAAYDKQQERYNREKTFSLLSLISMALLELGIIVELDEDGPVAIESAY